MTHISFWHALRSASVVLLLMSLSAMAARLPVDEELERLSAIHGFKVVGIEATEEAVGRVSSDELYPRLRRLLEDFDYVIVQAPSGGIDRVIVLGEKVPFVHVPPMIAGTDEGASSGSGADIAIKTQRRGSQHMVQVSLEGNGGKRMSRSLLIDTGADFVVLPASLISRLGIAPNGLRARDMQTANGQVKARVGRIPAVWIGEQRIPDVQVAFIDDRKLGNSGLLGMSVLGRFTMTIDDEAGSLRLADKGAARKDTEESEAPGEGKTATRDDPESPAPTK